MHCRALAQLHPRNYLGVYLGVSSIATVRQRRCFSTRFICSACLVLFMICCSAEAEPAERGGRWAAGGGEASCSAMKSSSACFCALLIASSSSLSARLKSRQDPLGSPNSAEK